MELLEEIGKLRNDLNISIKNLRVSGGKWAKAQHDYRVALAKRELELRSDKYPATLTYDIARGDERIAELKQEETNTYVIYDANQRAIDSIKLQLRLLENQLAREYGNTRNEV